MLSLRAALRAAHRIFTVKDEMSDMSTPRKRRLSGDPESSRAKLARNEAREPEPGGNQIPLACFPVGSSAWLTCLTALPLLNGEYCKILSHNASTRHIRVKRLCAQEELDVRQENLTEDAPDGSVACTQLRAVLARVLGRGDVAGVVLWNLTCDRCHEPCDTSMMCKAHPVDRRKVLGHRHESDGREVYDIRCTLCGEDDYFDVFIDRNNTRRFRRRGSKYCYGGEHSIFMPKYCGEVDSRPPVHTSCGDRYRFYRLCEDTSLPSLQASIDDLPKHSSKLALHCRQAMKQRDLRRFYTLSDLSLLKLEQLTLKFGRSSWESSDGVNVTVVLGRSFAPNLKQIMVNLSGGCFSSDAHLPALEHAIFTDTVISGGWVDEMVVKSPGLTVVEFTRVRGVEKLHFASSALEHIRLCKVVGLSEVHMGSPVLRVCTIRSCDKLGTLRGFEKSVVLEKWFVEDVPGEEEMSFASNARLRFRMTGVPRLKKLSLWIPRLVSFTLCDCKNFDACTFPTKPELESSLPSDYKAQQHSFFNLRHYDSYERFTDSVVSDFQTYCSSRPKCELQF